MSGSTSKSRKLSVFDRLGPEEDLSHSSSASSRHGSFTAHKRDRPAKSKHHRQGYEDEEHAEKFSQQSSYKERHGNSYSGLSHHYRKTSAEGGRSGSSECEDVKKEKHSKSKQHRDEEPREEYGKEKRQKTKSDKQPEYSDIEGLSDVEDTNLPTILDDLDQKDRDSQKYEKGEIRPQEPLEQIEDTKVPKSSRLVEEDKSPEEVFEDGKRFKAGKEKKRKHKGEKLKESSEMESHDRSTPLPEIDDQDLPSRSSSNRKKLVDSRSSVDGSKKKRLAEESSGYRERSSRSSKPAMAPEFDHGSNRDSSSWKSFSASEGNYKHSEMSSLDRHREDRQTSTRKTKSMYTTDEEYSRRGRDRDRPSDVSTDYHSRKRRRSYSPDGNYSSSKRQKRGRKDNIELYDSFSEEEVEGDGGNDSKKEKLAKNEVDMDLLFLEEDAECLKNTANSALDKYKPAKVLLTTGVSTGLCGSELYNTVSDIVLTHLESQDPSTGDKEKEKLLEMFQKNLTGLQVSSELQQYRTTNKLIKDVGTRNKAATAQVDLSIRNKLRKTARCFPVSNTELPSNWDSELYATGIELYKMNSNSKKYKIISSHCGSVVYT